MESGAEVKGASSHLIEVCVKGGRSYCRIECMCLASSFITARGAFQSILNYLPCCCLDGATFFNNYVDYSGTYIIIVLAYSFCIVFWCGLLSRGLLDDSIVFHA